MKTRTGTFLKAAKFLAIALAVFYAAVVVIVWSQQTRLLYPAPQAETPLSEGFDDVRLETEDGLALRAFFRAPDEGNLTLVYFHGNGGSLDGATRETIALADAGYGLLLVEYRGYGGNPGTPSEQGLYSDGRAAMAFLEEQGVAEAQTVLVGNSMGSGVATQLATELTPAALVLSAPFTTLPDIAATKMPLVPVRLLIRDSFDNLGKIRTIDGPVLVMHGTEDMLIPSQHGEVLASAAPNGELMLFEGKGHDLSFHLETQEAMVAWLNALGDREPG